MAPFFLADGLDAAVLAPMFARAGRLQITGFLGGTGAPDLARELSQGRDWVLTRNRGEEVHDYSEAAFAGLSAAQRAALSREIVAGARTGFQFCYDTIRLPKPGQPRPATLLAELEHFLCSEAMVAFFRTVTGMADIAFADAHASRYRPHHFLTTHDDRIDDQGRRAAYVLNLTPDWRAEWGGLLLFHARDGSISRGYVPTFNALTIFAVPQAHSVSYVTPIAPHPRHAVTGWLRTRADG
jgi:Rps23 Pro-64 3,4-dihydroxylase Tpa1-like proline 4-hydroxylase